MKRILFALAALLLAAAALHAHDFWIEPSAFHPAPGTTVSVALRVGEHFAGDPVARSPYIERFTVIEGEAEKEIPGIDGQDPAGWIQANGRMPSVIVYRSKPSSVELPPDRFDAYLRENGLEKIIALRKQRGEQKQPGREIFSRCAKSILNGRIRSAAITKPAGLRYEIVPEDPVIGTAPFRGRVLFDGKPLAGALIVATYRDDPRVRLQMRSNPQGRFAFTSPRRGVWLVTSVEMVRAPMLTRADWESLWASLTFES